MGELRESKKLQTRQRLSDVATRLFFTRGFDAVTVEEIAAAAQVSKMTVFNYFPRKEDLLFDREEEVKTLLFTALRERPKDQSPLEALERLIDRLRDEKHPFARVDPQAVPFRRVVAASPSLESRLREIEHDAVEQLAVEMFGAHPDGRSRLVAGTLVLTWRIAYGEAIGILERGGSAKKANAAFLELLQLGFESARALTSNDS